MAIHSGRICRNGNHNSYLIFVYVVVEGLLHGRAMVESRSIFRDIGNVCTGVADTKKREKLYEQVLTRVILRGEKRDTATVVASRGWVRLGMYSKSKIGTTFGVSETPVSQSPFTNMILMSAWFDHWWRVGTRPHSEK